MSKTPWTPGPWEVLPLQDGRRAIYTDAEMGFIGDVFGWEEDDPEQAEANARLIAAAPEMAEVLECLANMARHFPNIPTYGNRPRTGNIYTVADGQGEASITVEDLHRAAALLARIRRETS